jgi:hypothetical protein
MSTTILKMTREEVQEELEQNYKQQDAIVEKFSWPELSDADYIAAELRLKECQEREEILLRTKDFWEQIDRGLDRLITKKGDDKKILKQKAMEANKARSEIASDVGSQWTPDAIDWTKDSEYQRLYGEK